MAHGYLDKMCHFENLALNCGDAHQNALESQVGPGTMSTKSCCEYQQTHKCSVIDESNHSALVEW